MHHLPPHPDPEMYESDQPDDVEIFARSTKRVRRLKETCQRSLLVGVLETQFPQYQAVFGVPGRQTEEQLQNIRKALVMTAFRQGDELYMPNTDPLMMNQRYKPEAYRQEFPS